MHQKIYIHTLLIKVKNFYVRADNDIVIGDQDKTRIKAIYAANVSKIMEDITHQDNDGTFRGRVDQAAKTLTHTAANREGIYIFCIIEKCQKPVK